MAEVCVGVPSVVAAALRPALIGWGRARELMLRGHLIDATEALPIGLLQPLVAPAALDALIDDVVRDLLAATQKRLFLQWADRAMSAAIEHGVTTFVASYHESDEAVRHIDRFIALRRRTVVD